MKQMKKLMKKNNELTLGIFGNTTKEEVSDLLSGILIFLDSMNINFLVHESLSGIFPGKKKKYFTTSAEILKDSDFILSLGGDGTFLNTANIVGNKDIPILGINLGRLGFFSEVGPDEIKDFIPELLKNKFRIT